MNGTRQTREKPVKSYVGAVRRLHERARRAITRCSGNRPAAYGVHLLAARLG